MRRIRHALLTLLLAVSPLALVAERLLYDFSSNDNTATLSIQSGKAEINEDGLFIEATPHEAIELTFEGDFDFSDWIYLSWDMEYRSSPEARFDINITGEYKDVPWGPRKFKQTHSGFLKNKETRRFDCTLVRTYNSTPMTPLTKEFTAMNAYPNGLSFNHHGIIPPGVKSVSFRMEPNNTTRKLWIREIRLIRPAQHPLHAKHKDAFFPFIDAYGQFKHETWPGKIMHDDDFKQSLQAEDQFFKEHPRPKHVSKYGGNKEGPRLHATGRFRVGQHEGRWTLVDPEGYLFVSTGVNFVGSALTSTKVHERSHYFEGLPPIDGMFSNCYKHSKQSFNHGEANLIRKYGQQYESAYVERCLKRLQHWGFNTLGGWSVDSFTGIPESLRIPYTLNLNVTWKLPRPWINKKMMDVYDPRWKQQLEAEFAAYSKRVKDDPWLIGAFVNNELHWEKPNAFAKSLLSMEMAVPGKQRYIECLKEELQTIEIFNQRTGACVASWDALLQTSLPNSITLEAFESINIKNYQQMVEHYFSTIRQMFDRYLPEVLYLGCRFHAGFTHEHNFSIAAKYVDVLSINIYTDAVSNYRYPREFDQIDLPYIVSEFHFGALDRGMFGTGLNFAADQRNRGERYRIYMDSVLADPKCLGAHWFMMADEATAGFNGNESYNSGFLSVADQPYYEFLEQVIAYNNGLYSRF
jgi:hypothetical protein